MTDRYQVIRDALPILIAEAQANGGRNERAALIVELLEERDALLADRDRLKEALEAMLEIHGVTQRYADARIEIPQSWVDASDLARAALEFDRHGGEV